MQRVRKLVLALQSLREVAFGLDPQTRRGGWNGTPLAVQRAMNELRRILLPVTAVSALIVIPWTARAQGAMNGGLSVDVQVAATVDRSVTYSDDGAPYRDTSGLVGLSAVGNLGGLAMGGTVDGFPGIFGDGRMALGGLAGWQSKVGSLRIQILGEAGADRFSNVGGTLFSEQLGAKNSWLPYVGTRYGVTRCLPKDGHFEIGFWLFARYDLGQKTVTNVTTGILGGPEVFTNFQLGGFMAGLGFRVGLRFNQRPLVATSEIADPSS